MPNDELRHGMLSKIAGQLGADQSKMMERGLNSMGLPYTAKGSAFTSPLTGQKYAFDASQLAAEAPDIAKKEAKALINNALNNAASKANAKSKAKNQNLQAKLSGSDPITALALKQIQQQQNQAEYNHQYYVDHKPDYQKGGKYYYYEPIKKSSDFVGPKNELQHGLITDFLRKHKYVKREETNDGQKNKYRYFYSLDEWNKWKSNAANKVGSFFSRLGNAAKGVSNVAADIASSVEPISKKIAEAKAEVVEKTHKYIDKLMSPNGKWRYFYDEKALARAKKVWAGWKSDGSFMNKVRRIQSAIDGEIPTEAQNADAVNPGHRNEGKYRGINCQFCSLAQELRNRGYDVTAPDVPSGITNRTKLLSFFGYKAQPEKITIKCRTTQDVANEYSGLGGAIKGLIRGVESSGNWHGLQRYSSDGAKEVDVKITKLKDDDTVKSFIPCQEDPDFVWDGNNVPNVNKSVSALLNKMKEYPNGSRGNMIVYWNTGGGHSIVWEKDEEGRMTIRDTQSGNTILADGASGNFEGIRQYFQNVNPVLPVEMARLDDKSIVDDDILNYVDSNLGKGSAGALDTIYGAGVRSIDKLADTFKSVSGHK